MKTLRLTVDRENLNSDASLAAIDAAASILRAGGVVAFPTETVYGLGANALNAEAAKTIFAAKERPAWDPLIVHVSDSSMLLRVVATTSEGAGLTSSANALISAFWPGPLTLLLPRAEAVPPTVTAGRRLVGVRMPSHPVARALIAAAGVPIAAPSANRFGRISPTCADHVLEDLDGRIDAVLDAGETAHGLESTVVDASQEPVVVYRPGVVSIEEIRRVCASALEWKPEATGDSTPKDEPEAMVSPGLGIRHYAPRARLILIGGEPAEQPAALIRTAEEYGVEHRAIGVMLPGNFLSPGAAMIENAVVFDWGDWRDMALLAHRLFAGLRQLDAAGVGVILCPVPPAEGLGVAIRDRLLKAARVE
jgi:L-threonylcarbamoyladenylate synthase